VALPLEIAEFFSIIAGFWLLLPVIVRQLFYFSLFVAVIFAVINYYRSGSDD